jgi:hypothetical protein
MQTFFMLLVIVLIIYFVRKHELIKVFLGYQGLLGYFRIRRTGEIFARGNPAGPESEGRIKSFWGDLGDDYYIVPEQIEVSPGKTLESGEVIEVSRKINYGPLRDRFGVCFSDWLTDYVTFDIDLVTWQDTADGNTLLVPVKKKADSVWFIEQLAVLATAMETLPQKIGRSKKGVTTQKINALVLYALKARNVRKMINTKFYAQTSRKIQEVMRDYFRQKTLDEARTGDHTELVNLLMELNDLFVEKYGCELMTISIIDISTSGKNAEEIEELDLAFYKSALQVKIADNEAQAITKKGDAEAEVLRKKYQAAGGHAGAFASTQLTGLKTLVIGKDNFHLMESVDEPKQTASTTPKKPTKK